MNKKKPCGPYCREEYPIKKCPGCGKKMEKCGDSFDPNRKYPDALSFACWKCKIFLDYPVLGVIHIYKLAERPIKEEKI